MVSIVSLVSCATTGIVETSQEDSKQEVVAEPSGFSSPLEKINEVRKAVDLSENRMGSHASLRGEQWHEYVNLRQAEENFVEEQQATEDEIERTGELVLEPGTSYSFDLESYCVHAGKARPVLGDGLRMALLRGPAASWIIDILKTQGQKGVTQESVQYLIWALLSDVRFDELRFEDQQTLLQFYPDAPIRFGNRRLENLATGVFQDLLPGASDSISVIADLRDHLLSLRDDYQQLAAVMAPFSGRVKSLLVGWLRMEDGYFLRAHAESYTQVHFDIYVPQVSSRGLSSTRSKIFRPWEWVALPQQGQRLAVSTKVIRKPKREQKYDCTQLKAFRPQRCHELSAEERSKITQAADPKNFNHSRYQSPPRTGSKVEDETDCGNFVNEIYRRSGFDYPYANTAIFSCLSVFQQIQEAEWKPGDLILYKGHVGILSASGDVVSATWGGRQKRSMLRPDERGFVPAIRELPKDQAHAGSWKLLRWRCP